MQKLSQNVEIITMCYGVLDCNILRHTVTKLNLNTITQLIK